MEALRACSALPGFGFHPTDDELIKYLRGKILGSKFDYEVIPEVDIYKHEPWDLPAKCHVPTKHSKWHFFALPDRKYANGSRSNRATEAGYWKSTGRDRSIKSHNQVIGRKKTLVFHEGRPPCGRRTDWIMHEYYVDENEIKAAANVKDIFVLCRIVKRDGLASAGEEAPTISITNTSSQQPEDTIHSVVCEEPPIPSNSVVDFDAWIAELFEPDVSLHHASDIKNETEILQAETLSLAPDQVPVASLLDQPDDSEFLLAEDIYSILHSESPNFNSDVLGVPYTGELGDGMFPHVNSEVLGNDFYPYVNNTVNEVSVQDAPAASQSTPSTGSIEPANSGYQIGKSDTWIQIRQRPARPSTQAPYRIKLQVSKMESNYASVNHTLELVNEHHHLNLNDHQQRDGSSGSASGKSSPASDSYQSKKESGSRSDLLYPVASKAQPQTTLSVPSTGLNWLPLGACIIGTIALLLYFLQRDAGSFFANFSSLGL